MKALIAVDFSPVGREVAHAGYRVAQKLGMDATFFHCAPMAARFFEGYDIKAFVSPTSKIETDNLKQLATQKLNKVMEDVISENGMVEGLKIDEHVGVGDAGECVVEYARANGFDLIVVGYKSYSTIEHLIIGSTATKVARYAPCSVLIYRPEKER